MFFKCVFDDDLPETGYKIGSAYSYFYDESVFPICESRISTVFKFIISLLSVILLYVQSTSPRHVNNDVNKRTLEGAVHKCCGKRCVCFGLNCICVLLHKT